MVPDKVDVNIWMWIAGLLIAGWSALLTIILRGFGMRVNKLEDNRVRNTQCGFFREANQELLKDIKLTLHQNTSDISEIKDNVTKLTTQMELFIKSKE